MSKKKRIFKWIIYISVIFAAVIIAAWIIFLDLRVTKKFNGKRWELPARVYARPLELYEGLPLSINRLISELKSLGYRQVSGAKKEGQFFRQGDKIKIFTRGFDFTDGPEEPMQVDIIFSNNHIYKLARTCKEPLDLVRLEPLLFGGFYPLHKEDRLVVRIDQVSPLLTKAIMAIEDKNFYNHHGVSISGILRAFWINFQSGRIVQGGSTITQQLVKNFYLTNKKSFFRKLNEIIMALLLEVHYEKNEIFEAYLNEIYLGQDGWRSINGVGLASRYYFKRPINELDTGQIALIVSMIKGPSYYNPINHPERCKTRRNYVIDTLAGQGLITKKSADQFKASPLNLNRQTKGSRIRFPAYLELVKRQLHRDYNDKDLRSEGLRIFTSCDPAIQQIAEQSLTITLKRLEKKYGKQIADLQAAIVVSRPSSGEIIALIGDKKLGHCGFNRALDAVRPIGSLIKPLIYLNAVSTKKYTLATLLDDSFISIKTNNDKFWEPDNFDGKSHGNVILLQALSHSYNRATARLGLDIGIKGLIASLKRLDVGGKINSYPSILLGALSLSPLEVNNIYQIFPSIGFKSSPKTIRSVFTSQNRELNRYPLVIKQFASPDAIYLLNFALQGVMKEGSGRSAYHTLPAQLATGGKTGTSNGMRDSWFAGYAGDYLVVVWLGNDDNSKTPLTGSAGALKVWTEIISRFLQYNMIENIHPVSTPETIEFHWINRKTGLLTNVNCKDAVYIPFVKGTAPSDFTPCEGEMPAKNKRSFTNWIKGIFKD